jgi:hypothetical protein
LYFLFSVDDEGKSSKKKGLKQVLRPLLSLVKHLFQNRLMRWSSKPICALLNYRQFFKSVADLRKMSAHEIWNRIEQKVVTSASLRA